ncbi:MAG: tRNA (adenosine(37)-N6)-threonylcarbamoyltransferase complex ATPase subunit type 1 TsaE [Deltaproteobacteria bacterium]|nr:tRNA (adenosine(37)-N6)-threonylcarbamoyltransferase complex ATPase subunit type 1 TsaE [Deltaproteobacteria bacterium]
MWTRHLSNADETQSLGRAIGKLAGHGTVVALVGDLGAGKTTLAQGVGDGLGVGTPIVSPTFILLAEYEDGRVPLLHGDTYRLEEVELEGIGLEETIECWPGVVLLEWADRFPDLLPSDHLQVCLQHLDDGRVVIIKAMGPKHETLLKQLMELANE